MSWTSGADSGSDHNGFTLTGNLPSLLRLAMVRRVRTMTRAGAGLRPLCFLPPWHVPYSIAAEDFASCRNTNF
jgi:hypothetical protein